MTGFRDCAPGELWLTVREASEFLREEYGVHRAPSTIRWWIHRGYIARPMRIPGFRSTFVNALDVLTAERDTYRRTCAPGGSS